MLPAHPGEICSAFNGAGKAGFSRRLPVKGNNCPLIFIGFMVFKKDNQ